MDTQSQIKSSPNIFQRVLGVMSDLDYIQKGPKSVNGQYRYASHDQVTSALHPLFVKHGLVAIPSVEESMQDGNRTTVKLLTTFVNADNPTDSFTTRSLGYGVDAGDKGPGKAVSYAFKMACLKVFCLATGDDPDNDANAKHEPAKCQDFDFKIMAQFSDKDQAKMKRYVKYCSSVSNVHEENVKKEAVQRPEDFIAKFKNWNPKKDKE